MTTTTATKKFALATLAAPVLAALAIGMAGGAHADSATSAGDQISSLQAQGTHVVVTKDANTPLDQCSVVSVRLDHPHEHRGGPQHDEFHTAYIDLSCH
jgi:anti-sigma factor RsiW